MASIISAGTTSGTALNFTGDTSGSLILATNSGTTAVTISTAQVATFAKPPVGSGKINALTVFTSSGTWTKPTGCTGVVVEVLGGGGGGGGGSGADQGTGGSAGGYCRKYIATASLGATETVTVGAAGSAGASGSGNGGNGGQSVFGSFCTAGGGAGGGGGLAGPGSGGTATGGDINISGQQGGFRIGGGKGADSPLGTGGTANDVPTGSSGYGSGGAAGNGNRAGIIGQAGIVIVWELA